MNRYIISYCWRGGRRYSGNWEFGFASDFKADLNMYYTSVNWGKGI